MEVNNENIAKYKRALNHNIAGHELWICEGRSAFSTLSKVLSGVNYYPALYNLKHETPEEALKRVCSYKYTTLESLVVKALNIQDNERYSIIDKKVIANAG